jgi:hypothetical protein
VKRVLIFSFQNDFHALAIQQLLKRHEADADIVDTSAFPHALPLVQRFSESATSSIGERSLSEYHSVWWRRPQPPRPSPDIEDSEEARFARRECREALWGVVFASTLPFYNVPEWEQRAAYKPYQLRIAQECGLRVPDTLITNRESEVIAFAQNHQHVVYKAFSATSLMMTDTRPLRAEDVPELWRLRYAPAIFQEYVPLGREYRITLVEDKTFVAEVTIQNPSAHYDWRLDQDYKVSRAHLPDYVVSKLQALRKKLSLHSGSIDLRETPSGELYFLEINPSGQFLFLDIFGFGGTEVADAFCSMLIQ